MGEVSWEHPGDISALGVDRTARVRGVAGQALFQLPPHLLKQSERTNMRRHGFLHLTGIEILLPTRLTAVLCRLAQRECIISPGSQQDLGAGGAEFHLAQKAHLFGQCAYN